MHIVIDDPNGENYEGSLVDDLTAKILMGKDVVVLPIAEHLLLRTGIGGFFKRAWGSGIPMSSHAPSSIAPMTIFVDTEIDTINWAIRIVPDVDMPNVKEFNGLLRLMIDSSQPNGGSISHVREHFALNDLGAPDARGGWTLRGSYVVKAYGAGFMGLSVYGTAPGLRVLWSAITASRS